MKGTMLISLMVRLRLLLRWLTEAMAYRGAATGCPALRCKMLENSSMKVSN